CRTPRPSTMSSRRGRSRRPSERAPQRSEERSSNVADRCSGRGTRHGEPMSSEADTGNGRSKPGLAWPDHDTGPVPPAEYKSRPRDDELTTRKPLAPFDRVKLILAIVALFLFFFCAAVSDNPTVPALDA